ncbi:hypothetical protein SGFS_032080 [Streptomyces graminofaciens]|uniref:Uncharacterized protein n=1 Tax=Streptomyces graminofaciens TaxID=68212 RepID=A0ABN5VFN7_9ACTN|nr:hypothetical protein SGFS_032080 [Streptomyces graminofaciens]
MVPMRLATATRDTVRLSPLRSLGAVSGGASGLTLSDMSGSLLLGLRPRMPVIRTTVGTWCQQGAAWPKPAHADVPFCGTREAAAPWALRRSADRGRGPLLSDLCLEWCCVFR